MGLFKRQQPEAAPKPKRARKLSVTEDALGAAVDAIRPLIYSGSTAASTLERLCGLVGDVSTSREPVRVTGQAPVTTAELDAALAELADVELPANAMRVLKQVRTILAEAEQQAAAKAAAEPPQYVTLKQLEDIFAALGAFVGCSAAEFSKTHFCKGDLIRHLNQTAERSAPRVRPYLRRLVDAVCTYREPPREPESYADRVYREQFGRARQ
jgi:hypothetical protein